MTVLASKKGNYLLMILTAVIEWLQPKFTATCSSQRRSWTRPYQLEESWTSMFKKAGSVDVSELASYRLKLCDLAASSALASSIWPM